MMDAMAELQRIERRNRTVFIVSVIVLVAAILLSVMD
jgi:hypothetical protein